MFLSKKSTYVFSMLLLKKFLVALLVGRESFLALKDLNTQHFTIVKCSRLQAGFKPHVGSDKDKTRWHRIMFV